MTYNPWNLPQTTVEPSTTAHPNPYNRTWLGLRRWRSPHPRRAAEHHRHPTRDQPQTRRTRTPLLGSRHRAPTNNCTTPPISSATTPVRAYKYDLVGNPTQINSSAGDLVMEYDDRNLLVSSSNPGAYLGTTASGGIADNPVPSKPKPQPSCPSTRRRCHSTTRSARSIRRSASAVNTGTGSPQLP